MEIPVGYWRNRNSVLIDKGTDSLLALLINIKIENVIIAIAPVLL